MCIRDRPAGAEQTNKLQAEQPAGAEQADKLQAEQSAAQPSSQSVAREGCNRLLLLQQQLLDSIFVWQRADGGFSWQLQAQEGHRDTSAEGMIGYGAWLAAETAAAVSYTHLDVYKRQGLGRWRWLWNQRRQQAALSWCRQQQCACDYDLGADDAWRLSVP